MFSFHSATTKIFIIGLVGLSMFIPLLQVQNLIEERRELQNQSAKEIASRWGDEQIVGGPVLVIPKKTSSSDAYPFMEAKEVLLPDTLKVNGSMVTEKRHYGIYLTPVYTSDLTFEAVFLPEDIKSLEQTGSEWQWEKAELRLSIKDIRGLREVSNIPINGQEQRFLPSQSEIAGLKSLTVPIDLSKLQESYSVQVKLKLNGTQKLQFLPFARRTDVHISAQWGDPSFIGAFLPAKRTMQDDKFEASWQIPYFNRDFDQHWENIEKGSSQYYKNYEMQRMAFGVELYQPAGLYQQNTRAGKYGFLFIGLTFVAFFLFEILKKLRVHPVQYLLIGVALCTFYIVLLAFSEQIGFSMAYLIAASCVIAMVGGYASSMLGGRKAGITIGGMLTLVYGVLYGLIISEQYSLLLGAIMLLVVVGLLMYLTRRIDWYALGQRQTTPQST